MSNIDYKEIVSELYNHLKTNLPNEPVGTDGFYDELMIGKDVNKAVEAINKYKELFEQTSSE